MKRISTKAARVQVCHISRRGDNQRSSACRHRRCKLPTECSCGAADAGQTRQAGRRCTECRIRRTDRDR